MQLPMPVMLTAFVLTAGIATVTGCDKPSTGQHATGFADAADPSTLPEVSDPYIPNHAMTSTLVGEWEVDREVSLTVAQDDGGDISIKEFRQGPWTEIVNNVRWDRSVLHYDSYMYYGGVDNAGRPSMNSIRIEYMILLKDRNTLEVRGIGYMLAARQDEVLSDATYTYTRVQP